MPETKDQNDRDRVGLNEESRQILDELIADGFFKDAIDAYRLAAALAIEKRVEIKDHQVQMEGHMYLRSQIDPDGHFGDSIAEIFPEYSSIKLRALEKFADLGMPLLQDLVTKKGSLEFWEN